MTQQGLTEIQQTYTTLINGAPVIVYNVPMLKDDESGEAFLAPDIAAQLFELLSHPENKTGEMLVDVYRWQEKPRVTTY
jgi:hypothetical protein